MRLTVVIAAILAALGCITGLSAAEPQPTREEAVRFLLQASFGPTEREIEAVQQLGYGGWIENQFSMEGQTVGARLAAHEAAGGKTKRFTYRDYFWEQAIYAPDQLRMRTTFALSQIVVVSVEDVKFIPEAYTNYVELLRGESLGHYGDLVRGVTYLPVMAEYLTYMRNMKADPVSGRQPDENYAREVMQLFTIGLEELAIDGTPSGDETYTSEDVEGLAEVFTGFSMGGRKFRSSRLNKRNGAQTIKGFSEFHEPGPKTFLGTTIPAGLSPEESVDQALDHLLAHPNVAPFMARLLIQKFVTSNPSPDYIRRVAEAYNAGAYTMPSGNRVGDGKRGAMKPVVAAILLDEEAREPQYAEDPLYGKVREPVLRIAQVVRALADPDARWDTDGQLPDFRVLRLDREVHNQLVFAPPSVFGFYRPGYVAAGTQASEKGLVAPEMQILTSDHIMAQARYYRTLFNVKSPDYLLRDDARLLAIAEDPEALVAGLSELLLPRPVTDDVRRRIERAVAEIRMGKAEGQRQRAGMRRALVATMMLATTPEFTVQR